LVRSKSNQDPVPLAFSNLDGSVNGNDVVAGNNVLDGTLDFLHLEVGQGIRQVISTVVAAQNLECFLAAAFVDEPSG